MRKDPRVQLAVRKAALYALPQAFAFMRHRRFILFLSRDAGYLAFPLVAQGALSEGEHDLSFTTIAERLGVSRTAISSSKPRPRLMYASTPKPAAGSRLCR